MRILLIEDDRNLSAVIETQLKKEGYVADCCYDGETALTFALSSDFSYDVVLLDRMLPIIDGMTILKAMREKQIQTPVLMITALGELEDKIDGLDCGADDYLVKPFHIKELSARIRALVRRPVSLTDSARLSVCDLSLDPEHRLLSCKTGSVLLTGKESELLQVFMKEPERTHSREELLWKVWGGFADVEAGNSSETYYGIHIDILTPELEKKDSIIFICPRSSCPDILWNECRHYPFLWLLTLAAMYAMSRLLIGKALLPIEAGIKSQKEFIAAASHELKAPLAVIQANAEAMDTVDSLREQTVILEECGHMAKLLESLLSLAAKDAGSWQMNMRDTDMDTLLIDTWEAFLPACRKKSIALHLDTAEECFPKICCDGERIRQVFRILLDNALEHVPAGTSVELRARMQDKFFVCSVADHGPGIPDEKKKQVFDRFYCGDASRSDKNHFGLGLSIAKEIMELHRGTLTLSDTSDGGCTFTIRLPISSSR